ncbi:MAG: site-specific integrase [Proteobacteria bacterium]|nr:site-specific integrase [Pseudomonadota bacterium]
MASIRARTDTGMLFLDFRYQGIRCREQTLLADSSINRKRLSKLAEKIEEKIALGEFNYREFFPGSKNAGKFDIPEPSATVVTQAVSGMGRQDVGSTPLFKEFAEVWYAEKSVEWRTSHKKTIRDDINKRLVPRFGDMEVGVITKAA